MTSRYPNAIDGYADIRVVRDAIDEVVAADHNSNRSAVVAIEQALGVWPQGIYGTVVERLDEADENFTGHVSGAAFRHPTNHIDYPGSSPKTFADGYAMVAARLGSTISEIVARLGASTGDAKIGANVYTTANGKFRFPTGSVSSQLQNAGDFTDEVSGILENGMSGFVVQGMQVIRNSQISVTITAGQICVRGRMQSYAGGMLIHSGIGTHMIYAAISGMGVVSILDASTYDQFVGVGGYEPTVMLQSFTETGSAWIDNDDLRRFGMYANNKPYLTVGEDGHGADFTSLQSALKYVDFLQKTTNGAGINRPYKVAIVGDITHTPVSSPDIIVPPNVEIDGGGHTLSWSLDYRLFDLGSNATLRNIRAVYAGAPGSTQATFARIAASGAATSGQRIIDCMQTGADVAYFVWCVDDGSGISDVTISGCSASAQLGHVTSTGGTPAPSFSRIVDNRFYQTGTPTGASGYADIRVGGYSIVANNYVTGGFTKGIEVYTTIGDAETLVANNKIDGGTGYSGSPGRAWMTIGINANSRCLISNNFIKGIYSCGIQCITATNTYIVGNFVDNSLDNSSPTRMNGILEDTATATPPSGLADNNLIAYNFIVCPGPAQFGIRAGSSVIGNFILGEDALNSAAGIRLRGYPNRVVANNVVKNVNGIGLHCDGSTYLCVSGNMFINDYLTGGVTNATAAITNFGDYSTIVGNMVQTYGVDADSVLIQPTAMSSHVVISRNTLTLCSGTAIDVNDSQFALVESNFMTGGSYPLSAILKYGSQSVVANNFIRDFGRSPQSTIISASVAVSGPSIVSGNMIAACQGNGIDGYDMASQNIIGNMLIGSGSSASGIKNIGAFSLVASNVVREYSYSGDGYGISATGSSCVITGNAIISQSGNAIDLATSSHYSLVTGNYIDSATVDGIKVLASDNVSVCGNYINFSGSNGIWLKTAQQSLIAHNFVNMTTSVAIYLGDFADDQCYYANICGNYIRGCVVGIGLFKQTGCLVACNMIMSNTSVAIDASEAKKTTIVGNMTLFPGGTLDGIVLTSTEDILLVGNRCEATAPGVGFSIDNPNTAVTAAGNVAYGTVVPTDFFTGNNIDGYSCRQITPP